MATAAFDMLGTFFSLERVRRELTARGAPALALELWFSQSLRDFFACSHSGGYVPLRQVLEAALPRTLRAVDVDAVEASNEAILAALGELEPQAEAAAACDLLQGAGWSIVALTNGSEQATRALLERSGLLDRFEAVLSCDSIRKSKPHPEVYALARRRASGNLWMVAAHAWDVAGAARAGCKTAWVSAGEKLFLAAYPQPDVVAADLRQAAELMLDQERE
jgi:2-haloacid dehalogenase